MIVDSTVNPELPLNDKYHVVRKLASGGMGDVYLARQKGPVAFNRLVVLKTLHPDLTKDPDFVAMFLNEAQLVANLTHPNIVHVYELFQEGSTYVMAMEYVRGASVLDLIREYRRTDECGLPFGPALRIATSVCDALHYAYHEPGPDGVPLHVIHRDVTPSNILVGRDGQTKLVDFGVAKALAVEGLTKSSTIKGKSGYLAPEQIRTQPLDHRADIFALGVVLWEMTVGERLFRRDNELQTISAILHEPLLRPTQRLPHYPKALEEIVMRALARKRDQRYADGQTLAADLRALARANGWDIEPTALSRLVEALPPGSSEMESSSPSSPSGSGSVPPSSPSSRSSSRPRSIAAGDTKATSILPDLARSAAASTIEIDADPAAARQSHRQAWITFVVMLIATAVFWLVIVPAL